MTKRKPLKLASLATLMILLFIGCLYQKSTALAINPYLPEWEHIPDGEPYVFEIRSIPEKNESISMALMTHQRHLTVVRI